MKTFTWEEIKTHNSESDCWVVIAQGSVFGVYDVTQWLTEHPGGSDIILEYAGKDATAMFEDLGHSAEARSIMKRYLIGACDPNDQGAPKKHI